MDESRNKVNVGDRIRIREFDDMAKEYGVDKYGDIIPPCPNIACFSKHMKKYCGATGTVRNMDICVFPTGIYSRIYIDFDDDKFRVVPWVFMDYMVTIESNTEMPEMQDIAVLYT